MRVILVLCLWLMACPARAQLPPVVDLAPDFERCWASTQGLSESQRVARFRQDVLPRAARVYDLILKGYQQMGRDPDAVIGRAFQEYPAIRTGYLAVHADLAAQMNSYLKEFMQAFPDFSPELVDVYIMHSLGGSNAALFPPPLCERCQFYLGVDMIVRYNTFANQKPFFDHEFFHAYHVQHGPQLGKFYSFLWFEGLAVYAAQQLNPQATSAELQMPESMVQATRAVLPALAAEVAENLENTDPAFKNKYFSIDSQDPKVPVRAGYYLGYLAARKLAAGRPLAALARLQEGELVPALKRVLRAGLL